ncbi:hypothetical protein HAX54_019184 [Datura stramonium]|uniref:Uncharacterized protein n=1 Tax=Datura stramonium TaxID=4076 RepID=A0ABS8UNM3_DATST|nr:hypothetical protein [Datura stramonium]
MGHMQQPFSNALVGSQQHWMRQLLGATQKGGFQRQKWAMQHKAWHEAQAQVPQSLTRCAGSKEASRGATPSNSGASRHATRAIVGASRAPSRSSVGTFSAATQGTVQAEKF